MPQLDRRRTVLRNLAAPLSLSLGLLPGYAMQAASPQRPGQVIAYLFLKDRLLTASEVPATKLTRINYAFANIKEGEMVEGFAHDPENFALLVSLKQRNPALQLLVSVGGWSWSGQFSDVALTPASRKRFIESAVRFVKRYDLDGLDIDWEYPGLKGAGNKFRAADKQNYTILLRDLRVRFDREEQQRHRRLLTSVAAGANSDFLEHTQMGEVARFVDTVNLMTYDFYGPDGDRITGNHAPLFTDPADPKHISAERSVREYEAAGVPADKIVLGVPFYGKSWSEVGPHNYGLFQSGSAPSQAFHGYSALVALQQQGYIRHWDETSSAPSLYNEAAKTFISYEDPQSLAAKCSFVLQRHLGGVMLSEDADGALLSAIDKGLKVRLPRVPGSAHAKGQ